MSSSLLESELERLVNLRFAEVINEGPINYTGDFSNYSYEISFYYVAGNDLNTQSLTPTEYKRAEIRIFHLGFPTIKAVTLITNN